MINNQSPYLSVVVASRNDNHGGDMLQRMRIFVQGLIHQCNKHQLPCELIFVEWNPPLDKDYLKVVLPEVKENDFLSIRYIIVPNEIHKQLAFSDKLPLFQMIAKNVGIKRAKADFVLCANIDLLFSDELFIELSKKNLQQGVFYRANRCDVPKDIYTIHNTEEQLMYCKKNILKRLGKNCRYANFTNTTGIFFRYRVLQWLLPMLSIIKSLYAKSINDAFNELDFDACGDFTLMSKNDWLKINGYPELEIYSIHIDSMGIISAAALGLKQKIFTPEACVYHIEHAGGWEFKTPDERINFYTKFPMLEWWAVREAGLHLLKTGTNWNLNKKNWGLSDIILKEF
ncbi:MAG: hypothetical protein HY062_07120 [Bacteroidetes bacterium]|nr:hypothetical protein [Bacteroidota bacterium]